MNLVLTWCWKEWRSQRGVLLAYTLLGLASLCLVFLLVPESWWQEHGKRALALSWFFALGVLGVLAFVAPALVRNEFGSKNDQFVRRLPGALLPSFGGKLLFLALAAAALPLVCLLAGEAFLLAIGQPWHDLFLWEHNGEVSFQWPWPAVVTAQAALLVTWVWAIGTWLPNGRMALGGTILFVLLLGVGVFAVLRQSPGLEQGIAWQDWLWWVPALGLAVAGASWTRGRRGGGPLRSARFGLCAAAVGFAPPSLWLAARVHDYHHPDLQKLVTLYVHGTSPDGRYVLAAGAENGHFANVPIRIDLQDGSAIQIGSILTGYDPQLVKPYTTFPGGGVRYWRRDLLTSYTGQVGVHELFDLVTGEATPCRWDEKVGMLVLPPALADAVRAEAFARTPLRAPGGRRAWFDDGAVCIEGRDDTVDRVAWRGPRPVSLRACGHGFTAYVDGSEQRFDLVTRQQREAKGVEYGYHVGGAFVFVKKGGPAYRWLRQDGDGAVVPIPQLDGCGVLGLFDDERLLCTSGRKATTRSVFLFGVRDGERVELPLPAEAPPAGWVQYAGDFGPARSLLPRDPAGRVWLRANDRSREQFVLVDGVTLRLTTVPQGSSRGRNRRLLGWPDAASVLLDDGATICRVDVASGVSTQLFPR